MQSKTEALSCRSPVWLMCVACSLVSTFSRGAPSPPAFTTFTRVSAGDNPSGLAIADLDDDGYDDIVVASPGDTDAASGIYMLRGQRGMESMEAASIALGARPVAVAIADFDNNGSLDIASTAMTIVDTVQIDTVVVLLNYGDATFGNPIIGDIPAQSPPLLNNPLDIAAGDVNSDGHVDVVVTSRNTDTIVIFSNDGTGQLAYAASYFSGGDDGLGPSPGQGGDRPRTLALGDLDGDGDLDAVVSNVISDTISVLERRNSAFVEVQTIGSAAAEAQQGGDAPDQVRLADLSNDGDLDLIVGYFGSMTVSTYLGVPGAGFMCSACNGTPGNALMIGSPVTAVAVIDANADEIADIAVGPSTSTAANVLLFIGRGDGSFLDPILIDAGLQSANRADAGDFDGDGDADLVFSDSGGLVLLTNDLISPCSMADISSPFGTLDDSDIREFLIRPAAALADPVEAADIFDLFQFLDIFEVGCDQ